MESYLAGHHQRVKGLDTTSSWLPIPAGVPQGSVLGPLLFLFYTIDLRHACTNTNTTCSQFADHTALITSTPSLQTTEQQLQETVSSAGRWLKDWHLLVNVDKIVTVIFHHDNWPPAQQTTIYLDEQLLTVARKQSQLSITFQHDLRWTEHTNVILNKLLASLKKILRLRNPLNSSALAYLYSTYIRPELEYACIALISPWTNWNGFNAKLPGYVFAYHSTPLLTTHTFLVDLVFLHSAVVGISNTFFLHTPYITVMPPPPHIFAAEPPFTHHT